jgi:superfamily II DNA/RNA helicase
MKFEETYLNDNILDALYDMHFEDMTPIQERCIPEILDGYDVLGVAQTGTGKTAAYLLPILSELDDGNYPKDAINAIIMSPTRELAQQIDQAMQGFGYYLDDVSSVAVYGGNDGNRYDQELRSMRMGADVLIATPGRLLSHLKVGNLDLSRCSFFVLDEADRMLDMGFIDDILKLVKELPDSCQRIMFSATMPKKIRELAVQLLHDPVEIQIAVSKPAEKIHQMAYVCYEPQKLKIIQDIFKKGDLQRVIIFSGKKERVKEVTRKLKSMHINCDQMHSDLSQAERNEVMYRFKAGQTDVLVATDIVARGIDIDDIRLVINYDVPADSEDYVHRIGRTARADRDGEAITFVSDTDMYRFQSIEHFLGKEVEKLPLPEGLGEAPEYKKREKKPNSRRNGRWHSKGHGKGNGKGNGGGKGNGKGKPKKNNNDNKAHSKDQSRS